MEREFCGAKPNFFVIGAEKAGTTRLCHLLSRHPDVFIPELKEPQYFAFPQPSESKSAWYQSLFREANNCKRSGEGSTFYSWCRTYPGTAERICRFNSQARLIYIVRHPLRRIESAWMQWRDDGRRVLPDFNQSVRQSPILLEVSLYWLQISQYREFFPDSQIQIVFFEEFIRDESEAVRRCCEFLDVDPNFSAGESDESSKNSWRQRRESRRLLDWLRARKDFKKLRRRFSRDQRKVLRNLLTKPLATRPQWDDSTLAWATEQLQNDTREFLRYADKTEDFWALPHSATQREAFLSARSES